ncbi:MAG: phloretin hydrolase [Lachnospiraceae bacterium]|nr:phloretin hydrolase [Lachnospiraceae bacterium]
MAVAITEEEKRSPLYKYFDGDAEFPLEELKKLTENCELTPEEAMTPDQINDLFKDGYLPGEFGYCCYPDGSAMLANKKSMPNVTVEMFDWWFCWHMIEPLRYKIWDPNNHLYCMTMQPEKLKDASIPIHERYWDTDCEIKETHLPGEPAGHVVIPFRNPADLGFDVQCLADFKGTIVCSGDAKTPVTMVHFVRPLKQGVELRSRFWYGYHLVDGKIEKMQLPPHVKFDAVRMRSSLMHNINEFTNLSRILPGLYEEYKDFPIDAFAEENEV